jgi:hypothetical protein
MIQQSDNLLASQLRVPLSLEEASKHAALIRGSACSCKCKNSAERCQLETAGHAAVNFASF